MRAGHRVLAKALAGGGLQGKSKADSVIDRAGRILDDPESDGDGPAPHVPVDRVQLLLQKTHSRVVIILHAVTPIVIEPVVKQTGDIIRARGETVKTGALIPITEPPAPADVRGESELVEGEIQISVLHILAHF